MQADRSSAVPCADAGTVTESIGTATASAATDAPINRNNVMSVPPSPFETKGHNGCNGVA